MGNSSNRIIIVLLAALLIVSVGLLIGSGACSRGGGGGSASDAISVGDSFTSDKSASSSVTSNSEGASTMNGYEDMTTDELRALLDADAAPVGSNPRDASISSAVTTAAETYSSLDQRGFTNVELSADFDMDGTYVGMRTIDSLSSDKYPSYMAFYESDKGIAWIIYINDGNYIAVPLGSADTTLSKQVVFSESEYVTQYDGDRNEYSEFALSNLPNMSGVKVARIDKTILDSYTIDSLEKV